MGSGSRLRDAHEVSRLHGASWEASEVVGYADGRDGFGEWIRVSVGNDGVAVGGLQGFMLSENRGVSLGERVQFGSGRSSFSLEITEWIPEFQGGDCPFFHQTLRF